MLLAPFLAAVTLSLSDSTDASVRSIPERDETSLDVSTTPAVGLSFTSRRSTLDLSYQTSLGWIDVTDDRTFVLQHSAGVGYGWGTRRLHLNLSLGGSYGKVSYLGAVAAAAPVATQPTDGGPPGDTPAPEQPTPVGMQAPGTTTAQLLPEVSVLEVASAGVGLSASYVISARWSATLGTGFSMGGGLGDSEAYLPFRYGPNASASVGYRIAKFDTLSTSLNGSLDITPEAGGRFYTVTLMETWTHQFRPLTTSTLGAGATYVQSRPNEDAAKERSVNAAGVASIAHGFKLDGGALAGVSASTSLNSTYNPVLGTITQSMNGTAGVGWTRDPLGLGFSVYGSRSLPFDDPEAFTSYGASTGASVRLSTLLTLRAGAYWTRQILPDTPGVAATNPNRWGASLGLTVAAPPIRL